jgi:paraquat-inducible protein A
MSAAAPTARANALAGCHDCELLVKLLPGALHRQRCPRCGARIHSRKTKSVQRCWALLAAAAALYLPANVLPIMTVTSFGDVQTDTIISGAIYLLTHGMWPLALVVFVASVLIPIVKLLVLSYLLYSVQVRSTWRPADRTRWYRVVESIGRLSMVDIYVVTILVALVRLDQMANVRAEPGALFFGAVVVLTILAAESFDPRLIWDRAEENHA